MSLNVLVWHSMMLFMYKNYLEEFSRIFDDNIYTHSFKLELEVVFLKVFLNLTKKLYRRRLQNFPIMVLIFIAKKTIHSIQYEKSFHQNILFLYFYEKSFILFKKINSFKIHEHLFPNSNYIILAY